MDFMCKFNYAFVSPDSSNCVDKNENYIKFKKKNVEFKSTVRS